MLVSEIIERTYNEWLYPAGVDRPSYDVLTDSIDETATTIPVQGVLSRIPDDTIVEIDSELILIRGTTVASLNVQQRGYMETAPASHSAGALVLVDPKYPRQHVMNALRSIIGGLWSRGIYFRDTVDTIGAIDRVIDLPSDTRRVISVIAQISSTPEDWSRLLKSRRDYAVFHEFTPPKLRILRKASGRPVKVVYAKEIQLPTSESDDLDTLGVPATLQPYLPMGIAGYLLMGKELPRIHVEEIRRLLAVQGAQVPPGASVQIGNTLLQMFWRFVAAEARKLREFESEDIELVRW
jgi:hypothetical protein